MSPRRRVHPADDPIPNDLTPEERRAVAAQGERLGRQEMDGVPPLFDEDDNEHAFGS